ncbi:MAG: hypothetical protein A2284_00345 [Deltaproteobacteria bacterium RIFOXYA12_FULL_61_11]|nr:MAG: hypothetical protein A2284_00345 [Deltaproteobacteria bacterium RIFOXYA12_FULL_61_11]
MNRPGYLERIARAFDLHPVVTVLGPRQSGKTTLARQYAAQCADFAAATNHFDLEDPQDLARLAEPKLALQGLRGLVLIDEVQRTPELFPLLRVLVDRPDNPARFLILGSASRDLIHQSSESLAGRIGHLEVRPFCVGEVGLDQLERLWLRGGFPRAFLAESEVKVFKWLEDYTLTFLERDLPQLGFRIPARSLRRFWMMLTHVHGNVLNSSELARSFGTSDTTIRRYLDLLEGTFMLRLLPPWHENLGKRQVKAPKVYFRDSGLLHCLLGIQREDQLRTHLKLGASWEGFALEEVIRAAGAKDGEVYFWGVHQQGELDLLLFADGRRLGYEFKYTDRPTMTRALQQAIDLLGLETLTVIHPGDKEFPLAERAAAVPLGLVLERLHRVGAS